jgi:hypothetical protein
MTTKPTKRVRCAVYTRVSTEYGLDQEFNSLDAQHEAAEAFLRGRHAAAGKVVAKLLAEGDLVPQNCSDNRIERPEAMADEMGQGPAATPLPATPSIRVASSESRQTRRAEGPEDMNGTVPEPGPELAFSSGAEKTRSWLDVRQLPVNRVLCYNRKLVWVLLLPCASFVNVANGCREWQMWSASPVSSGSVRSQMPPARCRG